VLGPVGRRPGQARLPARLNLLIPSRNRTNAVGRQGRSFPAVPRPLGIMQAGHQDRPGTRAAPAAAGTTLSRQPRQDCLRSRGTTRAPQWPATARAGHRAGVTLRGRRKYAEPFSYPGATAAE